MPPILFYFSFPPYSIPSKSIKSCSPCAPRHSFIIFYPSIATPACFWLVVVWYLMFGSRPRPRRIFFYYKFSLIISTAKRRHGVSPTCSAPVASPLQDPHHHQRRLWLVVVCSHLMAANNSEGSTPLSIFILLSHNSTHQTTVTRPSHTFHPREGKAAVP